ncbi:MAG: DUF4962 domain-containing protein [Sedimentisphaerales bacterium]|nr:DUF4962 domain-containing protein [Sedimentisphaerales bacterium]
MTKRFGVGIMGKREQNCLGSLVCVLFAVVAVCVGVFGGASRGQLRLDEREPVAEEWGYRPADDSESRVNPPSFSWRPAKGLTWEVEVSADGEFEKVEYRRSGIEFNVHCPDAVLKGGEYFWRYRGKDGKGEYTNWSKVRRFRIGDDAKAMAMPRRAELLGRIPKSHPRLFMRPENVGRLRELARGKMKEEYERLVRQCERLMSNRPATAEPAKYPAGMASGSDPWREIWWGNREYTIKALNGAATLAFTRLLGGPEKYGVEAKRILMECAKWDPKGSTGYRYNDEAGMPYAYYFSRTYTFVNDLLSDEEKAICRRVMKVRGDEMYGHLHPRHLWRPYSSHSNRAWHFLGEVGIAFMGEVEGAEDWVWFAMNVFYNVYPVWSDDDGGWHEGTSYWASYLDRFSWWADVMREAMGVNAYEKPFFSKVGYYAMYLMPPGKVGGGFGDLTAKRTSERNVSLMSTFASQARNGHWQWYAESLGGPAQADGYIGFIRGALPEVEAVAPSDLPSSRLFAGTGQAYLNTNITDAKQSVQVVFKSSPFGTQSHGYEANNSFLLWAYGERLLIRSGYRDSYGSEHHKKWMWSTRSVNNITVNGGGQGRRTAGARGEITAFKTTPTADIVVGEAGSAYEAPLERFTRAIIFVKPDLVVVFDRLAAKEASTFEYWLHAVNKISVESQHDIRVRSGDVACDVDFLAPEGLHFEQTDQYDPNPRPRIKLREWHLTGTTGDKQRSAEFVTLYRPCRVNDAAAAKATLEKVEGGYILKAGLADGEATVILPCNDDARITAGELVSKGAIVCGVRRGGGQEIVGLED